MSGGSAGVFIFGVKQQEDQGGPGGTAGLKAPEQTVPPTANAPGALF